MVNFNTELTIIASAMRFYKKPGLVRKLHLEGE